MSTLDNLRKAAKRWLKALRTNDHEARERFRRVCPDGPADPGLRDVQHALALERGAESWAALKIQLARETSASSDSQDASLTALLAAADRGDVSQVIALADTYPDIVDERGLFAFRGYVDRLRDVLEAQPDFAKVATKDGITPLWWLPDNDARALAIVELFLKHGADPAAK